MNPSRASEAPNQKLPAINKPPRIIMSAKALIASGLQTASKLPEGARNYVMKVQTNKGERFKCLALYSPNLNQLKTTNLQVKADPVPAKIYNAENELNNIKEDYIRKTVVLTQSHLQDLLHKEFVPKEDYEKLFEHHKKVVEDQKKVIEEKDDIIMNLKNEIAVNRNEYLNI